MIYLRRSASLCCTLSMLLILCSACSSPTETGGENGDTPVETAREDNVNYAEMAAAAVESTLKGRLKNPESLQVHSTDLDSTYEDDNNYFCTIAVDYSAQNGFGGYNRDILISYLQISKTAGSVTELDKVSYVNLKTDAQYGNALRSISDSVPLDIICSGEDVSQYLKILNRKGIECTEFTGKNGKTEIAYPANLDGLEGTSTSVFYAKSQKIYQIDFFWSPDQTFYTGTEVMTLAQNQKVTVDDVDNLIRKIDSAINMSHSDIAETAETGFHDYKCRWDLEDGIYIKLTWSVNNEDQSIGHIQLILYNEVNGEAE